MKKIRLSVLASAMLVASFFSAKAQTADEIIAKHIEAIGGADNWHKVKSVKMIASTNANGTEIPITITFVQNKGMKVEYTFNGMTGWSIITDKEGWNFSPFSGQTKPEAVPAESLKQSQDQLDIQGALIDYKEKGSKVTYLGKDDVEGTECYKVKLTYKTGKEETMYFDVSNYYHIKSLSKMTADGKEVEVASNMGNFQKLPEGIVWPMSMDNGGGPMTIKSVDINKPVPDDIFKQKEEATGKDKK